MRILGIDCAIPEASVAFVENGAVLAEERHRAGVSAGPGKLPSNHSEILLPLIQNLFKKTGGAVQQLTSIAVSIGPGSFTGLRIALATAQGLAYDSGVPLIGVSTLLANVARVGESDALLGSLLDARKKEVYFALFRRAGGKLTRLVDDAVMSIDAVVDILQQHRSSGGELVLVGDGAKVHARRLSDSLRETRIVSGRCFPSIAAAVAKLGAVQITDGIRPDERALTPVYLRLAEAQIKREKHLLTS